MFFKVILYFHEDLNDIAEFIRGWSSHKILVWYNEFFTFKNKITYTYHLEVFLAFSYLIV